MSALLAHIGLLLRKAVGGIWVTGLNWVASESSPSWSGYTVRVRIAAAAVPAGSKLRFTLTGVAGQPVAIGACYAQHAAGGGDPYDFASTPVQVTFGGNPTHSWSGVGPVVTDEVAIAGGADVVVALYFSGTSTLGLRQTTVANLSAYYKSGNDASTVDASGYTVPAYNAYLLTKVEAFQAA